ncbi:hypothetical protein KFK09_013595 [Dendrobium nobile]|uniref:C2H2-type domain-containing protein n=1 Tax=Dendrobium nobile TaxID=94219 RepID=A0A8T3B7N5_DENNO|nr:hypothetical protein KFK09_013595 [Dendrobium nobile]
MTGIWFAIKKSLQCKSEAGQVQEPERKEKGIHLSYTTKKKTSSPWCSSCSPSVTILKDVIHGSHVPPDPPMTSSCSPRSIGSSDLVHPLTHEVLASVSGNEVKIAACHGGGGFRSYSCGGGPLVDHGLMARGRAGIQNCSALGEEGMAACSRRKKDKVSYSFSGGREINEAQEIEANGSYGALACYYCGEEFKTWQALEDHHVCNHAVTELEDGESSKKIVEKICQASFSDQSDRSCLIIEKILKVHNMQKTLANFEKYRESVKARASKLQKKHARCIADGNELLRFHGTTISCSLGVNGSSSLCSSENCNVCRIIKLGFSVIWDMNEGVGVFTASTSERAFESIETSKEKPLPKKALLVCRAIAGRIHKPLDNLQEVIGLPGFDSLAGKVGGHSSLDVLYLLNPRALLPCFVVICKS